MFLRWLRRRGREKLLATPFPSAWLDYLEEVPHYRALPYPAKPRLRDICRILVHEKSWEGCKGLTLTPRHQVIVSALAAVLVVGQSEAYFDKVQTILLYPKAYKAIRPRGFGDGTVLVEEQELLGEADYRGPVILSWAEIEEDLEAPWLGRNLVFHEFAHQLDMEGGDADGAPVLPKQLQTRWQTVMSRHFRRLVHAVERDRHILLDSYGAENPAEFFAIVTEAFFDGPWELQREMPDLYDLLKDYYRQDPATWNWQRKPADGHGLT